MVQLVRDVSMQCVTDMELKLAVKKTLLTGVERDRDSLDFRLSLNIPRLPSSLAFSLSVG